MKTPIVINIRSLIGVLVVTGNEFNAEELKIRVEDALLKVVSSVESLSDCVINLSPDNDNGASKSQREVIESE